MIPHWAKDTTIGRHTYNARIESVHQKPSFATAWRRAQHCIIPAAAIYEPDHRSGKPKPTRISRADGKPMGIAGLWDQCRLPTGDILSFTMLTMNADDHPVMRNFHKEVDEKRMVVILPETDYDAWLKAKPQESMAFVKQYPAELLLATIQEK